MSDRGSILDIGAGVGKLCVVGALSQVGMWNGVELDIARVRAARKLARSLGVADRTMFLHGDAFALDWSAFDAIYLYKPFEFSPHEPSSERLARIARVQERLQKLPPRARVVTFHGFGGTMPSSYDLVYQERVPIFESDLVLWVQRATARHIADP